MKNFGALLSALTIILISSFVQFPAPAWCTEPGRDQYMYAQRLLDEKYFDLAAEQLERLLRDHPEFPDAAEAQFLLAESYFQAGNFESARAAYLRAAIVYSASPRAPEALFKVGLTLEKAGRPREAAAAYARVVGFYPQDAYAPQGLKLAADLYLTAGDTLLAETTLDKLVEMYPESDAADAARLYRAKLLVRQGDHELGRRYLEWLATRSATKDIAAQAWFELGWYYQQRLRFDESINTFKQLIAKYPESTPAADGKLHLADIYLGHGQIDDALAILEPLESYPDPNITTSARVMIGDAYFWQGDTAKALEYYESVAAAGDRTAGLKRAWLLEKRDLRKSLSLYLELAKAQDSSAGNIPQQARLRAAVISGKLKDLGLSAQLWQELNDDPDLGDTTGWYAYKTADALYRAGKSLQGLLDRGQRQKLILPWSDETNLIAFKDTVRSAIKAKADQIPDPQSFFDGFPASPLLDSALALQDFTARHHARGPNLMERIAELSARPPGSVSKNRWATDWGDFYLFEFKDPVKALDQYGMVLDDTLSDNTEIKHVTIRSLQAYLYLYENAISEREPFETEMYGDSARSLQQRLIRSDGGETEEITIAMEVLRLDLKRWTNQATKYASVLAELRDMMRRYGGEKVPTLVLIEYLDGEIRSGRADSLTLAQDFEFAASAISRTRNRRIASQLQMRQVVIAEMLGRQEQSGEMAAKLASDFPNTPGGGEAVRWLMENPVLASDVRLEWLEFLFERYPYLVQSVTDNYLAAELLDALGRPLEALEARQEAESLQNLGTLDLGRLNKPNSSNLYREAVLLEQAGQLQQAADRFRILLNLEPTGQHSVPALTGIARVYQQMGEVHTAIAYLDTLRRRDLLPSEMLPALRLEPWLWMELEEYGKALTSWHNLAQYETNPDSLFRCKVQAIVCQYRLGKLEEARIEAKDLYSDFKDRTDLDETKALFYLEKGYALDKIHSYPEARKQYETITGNHPTSAWADDAAYSIGWSLIQEGEKEAGTAQLERFIENYPESDLVPTARLTIGLTYYRAEKYSEAVSALRKAWEDENAGDVWLKTFEALIKLYRDAGFWDAAIRLSREYLERFPDAPDRLDHQMNIGWYFLQIGQWDDAVRAYKPLLPIADAEREAEVQFYIGEAYMNKAEYRTAILEYLKVKVLGRKTKLDWGVTALYKAGNCYESLGDKEGAARMYRKIIAETGEASNYGMTAKKRLDGLELK